MNDVEMKTAAFPPILPWKRPFWLLVLAAMLVFGFYQEKAKIQLNHYIEVMQQNPELSTMSNEVRAKWWDNHPQPKRIHYYVMEGTWSGFHSFAMDELILMKWVLSAGIVLIFFLLDGLFLKTTGHFKRWPWLLVIYALAFAIMGIFVILVPGKSGYSVAHEFLAFLQSPLPSLLIVLVPSLIERAQEKSPDPS